MSVACSQMTPLSLPQTFSTTCSKTYAPPEVTVGRFAFAQIQGDIHLVQVESPISPLSAVDLKVFRHEFVTIFRLLESKSLHPADVSILELIEDGSIRYEEENDTVFLARDVMDRLRKLSSRRLFPRIQRYPPTMNIGRRR